MVLSAIVFYDIKIKEFSRQVIRLLIEIWFFLFHDKKNKFLKSAAGTRYDELRITNHSY
jgi:hypothetical protein